MAAITASGKARTPNRTWGEVTRDGEVGHLDELGAVEVLWRKP
jgi:hypothetical protein